jgi:hypothetical protein
VTHTACPEEQSDQTNQQTLFSASGHQHDLLFSSDGHNQNDKKLIGNEDQSVCHIMQY